MNSLKEAYKNVVKSIEGFCMLTYGASTDGNTAWTTAVLSGQLALLKIRRQEHVIWEPACAGPAAQTQCRWQTV